MALAIAVAWCLVLELRADADVSRADERGHLRRPEETLERKTATNR
jgi:hypothetical protein